MSASGHATPAATEPSAPHIQYIGSWPELNDAQLAAIIAANVGSFILSWIMLRLVWKAPSEKQIRAEKELEVRIQAWKAQYGSIDGTMPASASPVECLEGESAGEYTEPWTKTFDFFFLILMIVFLAALCIWTQLTHPELFTNPYFWLEQLPKVGLMMFVSVLGGLCCRYFCRVDERGYIITSKTDKFKVNYTRKLQHFAAYLIPLVLQTHAAKDIEGPLTLCWGNWFTLLGFLVLIQPIRERFTF